MGIQELTKLLKLQWLQWALVTSALEKNDDHLWLLETDWYKKYKATFSWKNKRQKYFGQVVDHESIHSSPNIP